MFELMLSSEVVGPYPRLLSREFLGNMPANSMQGSLFVKDDFLYILPGRDAAGGTLRLLYRLNITTKVVTQMASPPTTLYPYGANTVQVGDRFYILGGGDNTVRKTCGYYNIPTNTWHSIASAPSERAHGVAFHRGGKIYLFGGGHSAAGSPTPLGNYVDIYDIATNTWSTQSPSNGGHPYVYILGWIEGDDVYLVNGAEKVNNTFPLINKITKINLNSFESEDVTELFRFQLTGRLGMICLYGEGCIYIPGILDSGMPNPAQFHYIKSGKPVRPLGNSHFPPFGACGVLKDNHLFVYGGTPTSASAGATSAVYKFTLTS